MIRPLHILPLVFLALLSGAVVVVRAHRATPAQAAQAGDWRTDVLSGLGNNAPTQATLAHLAAWQRAEGGNAAYNWLNTTQPMAGDSMYNSVGVRNYPDYWTGIAATVRTLTNGYYPRTLVGLQSNTPVVDDAEMGVWGTGGGAVRAQLAQAAQAQAVGQAYMLQGAVGVNVRAALDANGGALQAFTIAPGQVWSFGHSIAPISALGDLPVVCGPAGCYAGGGWCDLSALYVKVADQLGLESSFPAHAGVADSRFPGILLDEQGGGGDLTITNTSARPVTFQAYQEGDTLIIEGGFVDGY